MTRALGSPVAFWGHAIWNSALWNETSEVIRRWDMAGSGFYLRVKFTSAALEPFELYGWRPIMTTKGER